MTWQRMEGWGRRYTFLLWDHCAFKKVVKWYFISFLLPFVKGCTGLTKYGHKGRDANNSLKLGAIPKSGGKAIKGGMGNV